MRAGALSLRDTEWSSWSSLLGWHVRGIWAPNSEGTDIHTVDASRDQTMVVRSRPSSQRLIVAALACMLTRFRQRCRQCLTPTWLVRCRRWATLSTWCGCLPSRPPRHARRAKPSPATPGADAHSSAHAARAGPVAELRVRVAVT